MKAMICGWIYESLSVIYTEKMGFGRMLGQTYEVRSLDGTASEEPRDAAGQSDPIVAGSRAGAGEVRVYNYYSK